MTIYTMEQYSEEWWRVRNGKVTASMVWAVIKKLKKKQEEAQDRKNYRDRVMAQILCGYQGQKEDEWKGKDAEWGKEFETIARAEYQFRTGLEVAQIGFCVHDRIQRFGCSPDGIVGTDGIAQFKCPRTTTHLNYRLDGIVPEEYEPQLVAEMACTGRAWADFVSFDPRLKQKDLQLFVVRMPRDEARIAEIEAEVETFLQEVDQTILRLTGKEPSLEEQLQASVDLITNSKGQHVPVPF